MNVEDLTGLKVSDDKTLQDTMRRLAFFSTEGVQTYHDELLEYLAKNALARFDPGGHTPGEVRSELKKMIGFDIDYEQIRSALCRLVDNGTAYATDNPRHDQAKFGLKAETISEFNTQYKQQIAFEDRVIGEWRAEIAERNPEVTDQQLDALVEDLHTFSLRVYSQHAVDSITLYSVTAEQAFALLERFDVSSIGDILPTRDSTTHSLRLTEIPLFFRSHSPDRKRYIAQQLNQIFLMHMMQLDPTGAQLLANEISGGFLILDTNILIRLFGLDGPELQEATRRLLELSRGLNYRPIVTPQTITEYRQKIESLMHNSRYFPRMSRRQAMTALTYSGVNDLTSHYWRSAASAGVHVDPATVYEPYQYVDKLLEEYGIEVEKGVSGHVARDERSIHEETSFLKRTLERDWKFEEIPQHDAFHRLLILRLRAGHEEKKPLETTYWFLTTDTKLRFYDRIARKKQGLRVPYCVLTSQWMQLLYPYRSTVPGFEETLAESLDSPLFRLFPSPSSDLIHGIVSTMQQYEGLPESVIAKAIADKAFLREFANKSTESEKQEVVEDYILGELSELEDKLKASQNREADLTRQMEVLDQKLASADLSRSDLQAQLKQASQESARLSNEIQKMHDQSGRFEAQLQSSRQQQLAAESQNAVLSGRVQQLESTLAEKSSREQEREKQMQKLETRLKTQEERAQEEQQRQQLQQQAQIAWRHRMTRIFLIALTWIFAAALFVALNPLARTDDLKWLALTIPVTAIFISLLIAVYGHWPSDLRGKLVYTLLAAANAIALVVAWLKPFGISISDGIVWAALAVSLFTGLFEMFSFRQQAD